MSSFDSFIDSLADEPIISGKKTNLVTFPCGQCAGTGLWHGGRANSYGNNKCLACGGTGSFKTSARHRQKARDGVIRRKAKKAASAQEIFIESNEGLIEGLRDMAGWSSFAASLLESFGKYGSLTDGQTTAARNAVAKQAERIEARAKAEPKPKVSLARVSEIFETAFAAGLKNPKLRLDGIVLIPAKTHSPNAGAIYVKAGPAYEDTYFGKVIGGEFHASRGAPQSVTERLLALADDPLAEAVAYGRKTGACACCGRILTDHKSIAAGIGPICADKWGF